MNVKQQGDGVKKLNFMGVLIVLLIPSSVSAKITPIELSPPNIFNEQERKNDPEAIIDGIKQKIAADPGNYENYGVLAFAYDYVGDYANELEALKMEVRYMPDDLEEKDVLYGNLARAYMLNDQWEEGKDWLDKADAVNPSNFYNRWNAFDYYLRHEKDYRGAASQLKRLQEFYDDGDRDQYYEAYIKSFDNDVPAGEIIELFRAAVQLEPGNSRTHRMLGVAIRNSSKEDYEKNFPAAMKELRKALKLDPQHIPTYISIADTYMLLGARTKKEEDNQKALEWFQKAYKINPEDARLAYATGTFYYYQQDYDRAIEKLEFALMKGLDGDSLKEDLAWSYNNKAYALYQAGNNLEEGLRLIDKAIELLPGNGIILGTKAELLYKTGEYQEAHKFIKQALELEPSHAEMEQDLSMIEEAVNP
jgi:tetratricopeptide (TPR) repeat protein